jgi:hypothetical protein
MIKPVHDGDAKPLSAAELISNPSQPFRQADGRKLWDVSEENWVRTNFHNSMTWQLGDTQVYTERDESLMEKNTGDELLQRAMDAISSADFVGFYEDLPSDFLKLWRKEGGHGGWFAAEHRHWALVPLFYILALISLPRLQTLKYMAGLSTDEIDTLQQHNDLDLKLYEWARENYGRKMVLYQSFTGYFVGECWKAVVFSMVSIVLFRTAKKRGWIVKHSITKNHEA